ncbi:MAG: APC family permease, partial [Oscillospiraceae bacterium]|nr:APC family permease [Oscillospiraceae bacterium]
VFTVFGAIPTVFYTSVVRLKGGTYSQAALFVGETFSGFYVITYFISNCSLAMYAIGFTSYLISLVPAWQGKNTIVTAVIFTAFYILNLMGTEKMAKIQDYMFYVLVIALLMFCAFGLPNVHWSGYFTSPGFDGTPLITNGITGLLQASSFLTFATGGATIIVNYSAEAINPQKDIPVVIVVSTLGVAALYALIATCIGGILPATEVIAAGNLSVIAKAVMPTWGYYLFVIGGACFALGTTLNASMGWVTKPLFQAVQDGWLPASFGKLNKAGVPSTMLTIFYVINMAAILFGLDVDSLGQLTLIIGNVQNVILIWGIMKLPKMFPEQWAKSPFHVSDGLFKGCLTASILVTLVQFYMNVSGTTMVIVAINVATFAVAAVYAVMMKKSGKVHMNVAYELD